MINIDYALDENGELKDEYFFHWEDFKEEGINYYYFVGLRSAGKTFDLFKSMIKYKKCLLIRRTDPELEITFSECADDADVCRLLGASVDSELINFLRIPSDQLLELDFSPEGSALNILIKDSDLHFGNWKKSKGILA